MAYLVTYKQQSVVCLSESNMLSHVQTILKENLLNPWDVATIKIQTFVVK